MKRITILLILLMIFYFIADNHLNLYPLNNLEKAGNMLGSTLFGVLPFLFIVLGLIFDFKFIQKYAFIWAWTWLILQIWTWYIPYLQGAIPDWYLPKGYTETLRILPLNESNFGVDVQHNILQILSFGVAILLTKLSNLKNITE